MTWHLVDTYLGIPIFWDGTAKGWSCIIQGQRHLENSAQAIYLWIAKVAETSVDLLSAPDPDPDPTPLDLNNGDDDDDIEPTLSIIPYSVIVEAAPWIIQELILMGLKTLTVAEVLEMLTGQEFFSLDDCLQWLANVLRGVSHVPGVSTAGDDPKTQEKGAVRNGWLVKVIDDYDYGKKTTKKVWYKPYEDKSRTTTGSVMNFSEKCAYFQGKRVQAYDSRSAKYNAYKRGYGHGANDQFQAQLLMGHTRPCAPQLFYARGRRGSMRRY